MAGIAFLVAGVGAASIWGLTTPDPVESAPFIVQPATTTTSQHLDRPFDFENFSVDQIASGEPLEWELVGAATGFVPTALVLHEDALLAFAAQAGEIRDVPRGSYAWRSTDGRQWEQLGLVVPGEVQVATITSTAQGLMASGFADGTATLWQSPDGVDWRPIPLPESQPGYASSWLVATANDEVVVVAASENIDPSRLVRDRFLSYLGLDSIPEGMWINWTLGLEDVRFQLIGPFSFRVGEATGEDLRLSEEEKELVRQSMIPSDSIRLFSTADMGGLWRESVMEADWVESLQVLADNTIVAIAYGPTGEMTLKSDDGVNWTETSGASAYQMTAWREGLVGLTGHGHGLQISHDGQEWNETGLAELLPARLQFWTSALAGGEGGIATVLVSETYTTNPGNIPPLRIERDGMMFEFDPYGSQVSGTIGAKTYRWGPFSSNVETDLDAGVVNFLGDTETGEVLAAFTIDELARFQNDVWSREPSAPTERHVVFAVSRDGQNWNVQPPMADVGHLGSNSLVVTDGHVFTLISESGRWFAQDVGFEIWTAPIP